MEKPRVRTNYTRKTRNLMNQDTCVNGHDVTDKTLVGKRVDVNGRVSYICKPCSALSQRKSRPSSRPYNGLYRDDVTLKPDLCKTLRVLITDRLATADEATLLAIYTYVNNAVTKTNDPVTDSEVF